MRVDWVIARLRSYETRHSYVRVIPTDRGASFIWTDDESKALAFADPASAEAIVLAHPAECALGRPTPREGRS